MSQNVRQGWGTQIYFPPRAISEQPSLARRPASRNSPQVRHSSASDPADRKAESNTPLLYAGKNPHSNIAKVAISEWGPWIPAHCSWLTAHSSPKDIQ